MTHNITKKVNVFFSPARVRPPAQVHKDPEVEALLEGTNRETAFSLYNIRGRAQYPLKREDGAGGTDPEGGGAGTGAEDSAGGKATPKKRRRRTKKELAFAAAVAAATAEFEAKGEDEEADAGEGGAGARGEAAAPAEAPAAAAEEEDEGAQARGKTGASPAPAARKTAARAKAATSPAPRKALGPAAHAAEEAARAEGGTGAGAGAGPPTRDEDLEDEAAAIAALAGAADAEETELGQRGTGDVVDTDGEGNGEKNAKNANAKKKNRGAAGAAAILDEKPEVPATGEPSAPCEPDRRPEGVEYIGFRISAGFGAAAAKASWQVVRCLRGLPRWPKNAYHKDKVSAAIHHDKWLLGGAGLDPPITRTEARAKGLNVREGAWRFLGRSLVGRYYFTRCWFIQFTSGRACLHDFSFLLPQCYTSYSISHILSFCLVVQRSPPLADPPRNRSLTWACTATLRSP